MEGMRRECEERIFSNVTSVSFYKAYFFFTIYAKYPLELCDPTSTMGLQMFSFNSSFMLQSLLYTEYVRQKHTPAQWQKSSPVLICSVAVFQSNVISDLSHISKSVHRSKLNSYFQYTPKKTPEKSLILYEQKEN